MTEGLEGRRILITGAAGGLGPTVVAAAAAAGASLVLLDVASDRLDPLAATFDKAVDSTHVVDLLDPAAVAEFASSLAISGPVDAVWHLVGGWRGGKPIADAPLEDWDWLHGLLVRTTVHMARSFASQLTDSSHGRFIIISAQQAQAPTSTNAAYAASKAAAEATVLALADEFVGSAATANVIVVPAIVTPGMREAKPDKTWGSFVPAEQIADSLVYLSSDAATKMNGQRLRLYAGSSAS
ncbi:MAG TPA: SDR family oxidoreductase [Actinomycetes bacterium]|nr:SDR family oxidoreductase [Actinomycetes bacterium]